MAKTYRVIRKHVETYVVDGIATDTPEEAIRFAQDNFEEDDFEHVESSEYEWEAIPEDDLE